MFYGAISCLRFSPGQYNGLFYGWKIKQTESTTMPSFCLVQLHGSHEHSLTLYSRYYSIISQCKKCQKIITFQLTMSADRTIVSLYSPAVCRVITAGLNSNKNCSIHCVKQWPFQKSVKGWAYFPQGCTSTRFSDNFSQLIPKKSPDASAKDFIC